MIPREPEPEDVPSEGEEPITSPPDPQNLPCPVCGLPLWNCKGMWDRREEGAGEKKE
jgi:hypothetical protein